MGDGGFSLIELLAAVVVFAVVMLGVASSTVLATRTNRDSQQQGVAVNLANQVLECVKSQLQAGRGISAVNAGADCNPASLPAGFTVSGVSVTTDSPIVGMTRVQISISWVSPLPDLITFDWLLDT